VNQLTGSVGRNTRPRMPEASLHAASTLPSREASFLVSRLMRPAYTVRSHLCGLCHCFWIAIGFPLSAWSVSGGSG
jgi:hypothetical protein